MYGRTKRNGRGRRANRGRGRSYPTKRIGKRKLRPMARWLAD